MMPLLHMGQASLRVTNKSPQEAQVHKWWHGAKMQPRWRSIHITHSASKPDGFFTVASSWIGAKFPWWAKFGSKLLALELTYRFFLNNSARFFLRSSRCSSFKIKGSFPDLKKAVLPHRSNKLRPARKKNAPNEAVGRHGRFYILTFFNGDNGGVWAFGEFYFWDAINWV